MRYAKLQDGNIQISEHGKNRIRSLLAGSGYSLLRLALSMGWTYQKLWRSVSGYQVMTTEELDLLDASLMMLTGSRIDSDCCEPRGTV